MSYDGPEKDMTKEKRNGPKIWDIIYVFKMGSKYLQDVFEYICKHEDIDPGIRESRT